MNDQSVLLHEFFLLALNLAQMKRQDRVVDLFQQAWNAHDLPMQLDYSNELLAGEVCEPIATHKNAFGFFILRQEPDRPISEFMPLARNLIKLLAVILENLQREILLEKERGELEKTVEARVAEIQQQEYFISAVADTSPALIYVYDLETNCNVYSNSGVERLLNYSPEEIQHMGENVLSLLVHPEDFPLVEELHSNICKTPDDAIHSIEYRIKHKNGSWRHMQSDERVFRRNNEGTVTQKIGFALDITARKQAEQDLENYKNSLEELVQKRTEELRTTINLMAGREVRMAELKREVANLKAQPEQTGVHPQPKQNHDTPAEGRA
jgi:PAS domain S-box-containing protein